MTEVNEATAVYGWSPTIPDEFDGQLRIDLPEGFEISEEWWEDLFESNRHVRIDLLPTRELRARMVSTEGSLITTMINFQLIQWILESGSGVALESAAAYDLPQGFRKYPDGAWLSAGNMPPDPRPWRKKYDIVPDLIFEVRSPGQSVRQQQEKMVEWIEGGVRLGWLIDPFERKVWIYLGNGEVEELDDPTELSGEDVCSGLVIDMSRVWD
ncbi:MAG: Uma2 family endonuclease [Chloroflexota bacterium]|nr:Uma2 family endonuclease [Chloroflexota bacterium]MDE2895526.1 Uma2 family endonuclease [Chloroflexota bacterium]